MGSVNAAGADLYACIDSPTPLEIKPQETVMIPLGIKTEFTPGYAAMLYARSGLASKKGLAPANKVGVVDSDYRGEIMVALHNHSNEERQIENGERIAQFVITPYLKACFEEVDSLDDINELRRIVKDNQDKFRKYKVIFNKNKKGYTYKSVS